MAQGGRRRRHRHIAGAVQTGTRQAWDPPAAPSDPAEQGSIQAMEGNRWLHVYVNISYIYMQISIDI